MQATEGAKFWAGVCAELRNRGIRDVLIVCCDGLSGLPEAIEASWPQTTVQTSSVHNEPCRDRLGGHLRHPGQGLCKSSTSPKARDPACLATWVHMIMLVGRQERPEGFGTPQYSDP